MDTGKSNVYQEQIFLVDGTDLHGILESIQPDLVHAGPVPDGGYLAAATGYQPLICMSWGSDLLREVDQDEAAMKRAQYALDHSSLLLADCEAVKHKAVSLGFTEEKVVTFPWGIDLEQFQPGWNENLRRELGWEDKFVIFHSRSWEEVYGVDVMAKAFAEACRNDEDLRLLLLGSGSMKDEQVSIFKEAGVMDRVFFAGNMPQDELPDYYHTADLYISASHSDGSSISLLEALACGLPALVTDIPGNREWVQPGVNGWLFPDGDWHRLAVLLLEAKASGERISMAAANRALAEEKADWKLNQQKMLDAYRIFET